MQHKDEKTDDAAGVGAEGGRRPTVVPAPAPPDQVHYGQADAIHTARQNTLDGAFNRKEPEPPAKPTATWTIHRRKN